MPAPALTRLSGGFAFLLLLAGGLLAPPAAGAQRPASPPPPPWMHEVGALSLNALLGGLTGGVAQAFRGGSFQDGFTRGALGGAVVYGGKRIAVEGFPGAGMLGRQVAGVGASVVRNASDARPSLHRIVLPFGPVRVYFTPGADRPVHARVDLATTAAMAYGVAEPQLRLDPGASLSAGTPIFRVRDLLIRGHGDGEAAEGTTRSGVVYASDLPGLDYETTLAHEMVHVIQNDFWFLAWTDPLEDAALRRLPGGERLGRFVDPNLSQLVPTALSRIFRDYHDRPWEVEARFLSER